MTPQEDNKALKKRKAKQLYEGVLKALNDECDKLREELNKPFIRHQELIVQEEKNT